MADARLAKRMMMIKTIVEDKLRWRISFSFSQLLWFASPSCNLCLNRSFLVGWPLWKVLWAPWSLFLTSNFRKFETSKVPPSLPEASDWRKTIFFFWEKHLKILRIVVNFRNKAVPQHCPRVTILTFFYFHSWRYISTDSDFYKSLSVCVCQREGGFSPFLRMIWAPLLVYSPSSKLKTLT